MAIAQQHPAAEPAIDLVVKVGGGAAIDRTAVADDLAALWSAGRRFVFVHGGAETTNAVATALGHPPRFVTGENGLVSRRTDRRTLEIFAMVYRGQLNLEWVELLQLRGVPAVGLCGLDGRIFEGERKATLRVRDGERRYVLRDDWTGTVERVNAPLLRLLLDHGYLPVLTPPGASSRGEAINVDGDRAAAAIAVALGAGALVLLSDVPGLLARWPDPASLVRRLTPADRGHAEQIAQGRMRRKVRYAYDALAQGVARVVLAQGSGDRPLRAALEGGGTQMEPQ